MQLLPEAFKAHIHTKKIAHGCLACLCFLSYFCVRCSLQEGTFLIVKGEVPNAAYPIRHIPHIQRSCEFHCLGGNKDNEAKTKGTWRVCKLLFPTTLYVKMICAQQLTSWPRERWLNLKWYIFQLKRMFRVSWKHNNTRLKHSQEVWQ